MPHSHILKQERGRVMRLVLKLLRVLTASSCRHLCDSPGSNTSLPPVTVCGQDRSVRSQADPELKAKPTASSTPPPPTPSPALLALPPAVLTGGQSDSQSCWIVPWGLLRTWSTWLRSKSVSFSQTSCVFCLETVTQLFPFFL